jgi:MerR family transcriptional regulator, light-induced transcriptional regulator
METNADGYLRIGELARRAGVSAEVLRAWERRYGLLEPSRSSGGFRLYSDADLERVRRVRELISTGVSAAEAARQTLDEGDRPSTVERPRMPELEARLESALNGLDAGGANDVFDELLSAVSVETLLVDVVLPYLRRLGERWRSGDISVGHEHFASAFLQGRLLGLARGWSSGAGPSAILACPPGEKHELGLIAFGILIAARGWRVIYLGADTPFESLERTARLVEPDLVVLAVSTPKRFRGTETAIRDLGSIAPVAIGGAIDEATVEELGARSLPPDIGEAARSLTRPHTSSPTL